MNETIVNGIFTILGTITGGLLTYLITKNDREFKRMEKKINMLVNQTISYWNLEKLYTEKMSELTSKPKKTILQEYREHIEELGFERPTLTEKEAKKFLDNNGI